ncbi:MAG: 3,4-dihydroxy 2-butanone 4-phosphate synthase [Acidobacteriota bacterium]|jgi:3,4-dihydroxy 2-butanone 4-phosphate synthase/GTP cyclohydrolase II|nr:3,4-dihydroxy 2-butanone 4-phosphate synthase [Acidobacteriota bacterium]
MHKPEKALARAIKSLQEGKLIILKDSEDRENEYDLCFAAQWVTPQKINFLLHRGRGLICVPMLPVRLEELKIPPMLPIEQNTCPHKTGFTVSVNARFGIKSGISTHDRSQTIRCLASKSSVSSDFTMPGHVFPLRVHDQGLEGRQGQTEASVELMILAGLNPIAVICEILAADGLIANEVQAKRLSRRYDMPIITIPEIIQDKKP